MDRDSLGLKEVGADESDRNSKLFDNCDVILSNDVGQP